MQFIILKGLICLILLIAITVKAEFEFQKECLEVEDLTSICEVNSEGKIDKIELYLGTLTEKEVDKILSYKTITKLFLFGIDGKRFFTQKIVDKVGNLTNLEELEISDYKKEDKSITFEPFRKLKKVKSLTLWASDVHGEFEKDILDKFENIKQLELWEANLDQNDINIIGSYKNLEYLMIYEVEFEKNLDYSPFKNIKELFISGSFFNADKNFIKGFKGLKKLTIEGGHSFEQSFIDDIANLPVLEEM